jgi:transcriptional regulator GlxA family with amidase domain
MNNAPLRRIQNWQKIAADKKYSVKGLADKYGVSVRALERLFLSALGVTPRRCLKRLRMQRAIELLRDGSNVSEAAFRLGYQDPSHFSRDFKAHYGFVPKRCPVPATKAAQMGKTSHSAMKLSHSAMK